MSNNTYGSAPYNFIPFPKKVVYRYESIEDIPKHNSFKFISGTIRYEMEIKTPLFINNGSGEFFNIDGECQIPGSTLRGKIRSNLEIISKSYPEFIEDKTIWYRGLADKTNLREDYERALKGDFFNDKDSNITNYVKAGYLEENHGEFYITPAKEIDGKSFRTIHEKYLKELSNDKLSKDIYMYENVDWYVINQSSKEKIKGILKSNKNRKFKPYRQIVEYKITENRIEYLNPETRNNSYGYLLNSSNLGDKKKHYLIYEKNTNGEKCKVAHKVKVEFETYVKYRQNKDFELFNLDFKKEKEKPVFYRLDKNGKVISFAFTPYMKLPYRKSISAGIVDNKKIDYANGIFGFVDKKIENENYKGRVFFKNAKIKDSDYSRMSENVMLMEPKPTSFQLYLKQVDIRNSKYDPKVRNNYNSKFELRGRKFYWLRDKLYIENLDNGNMSQTTEIKAIKNGTFFGEIHFENLQADELGLLLMSIKLEDKLEDSIGQGKPYGFGRVEFTIKELVIENNEQGENELDVLNNIYRFENPLRKKSDLLEIDKYRKSFEKKFEEVSGIKFFSEKNIDLYSYIKSRNYPDLEKWKINYMPLNEFRNRDILKSLELETEEELGQLIELKGGLLELSDRKEDKKQVKNREEEIEKNTFILVISNTRQDESFMKITLKNFKNVVYKLKDTYVDLSENYFELIIFNNIDGTEIGDKHVIEEFIRDENLAYLYFNGNFKRYEGKTPHFFNFANTHVTLNRAIIELVQFRMLNLK